MQTLFFYTIVVGLTSGIFFRSFFVPSLSMVALTLLISLVFLFVGICSRRERSVVLVAGLFLVTALLGGLRMSLSERSSSLLSTEVGTTATRSGVVVREPEPRANSTHLYIEDNETGELFLVYADPYSSVSYGDSVEVTGSFALPESFEGDTGRVFNYPGFLKARGVTVVMYRSEVEVVGTGEGSSFLSALFLAKHTFLGVLERAIVEPAVGLGEGMLLGVRRALGEDLEEVFRTVGIIHIVVLSGYNIMVVVDFVMRILGYIARPRIQALCGVLSIITFALLVGLSATVVRASIMASLALIARYSGRTYAVVRALSVAGIIMLLHNPYLLAFDPGFQLSFLATLGLILLTNPLEERLTLIPKWGKLRGFMATTLSTQIFVLPLLMFFMGTVSLVSVIANLLVLPFVPFAMLMTFLTGLVGLVSEFLAGIVGFIAYGILSYIIGVAVLLSRVPFAEVSVPPISFEILVLLYALLALFVWWFVRTADKEIEEKSSARMKNDYAGWVIETK